jgi:hypothetical protein
MSPATRRSPALLAVLALAITGRVGAQEATGFTWTNSAEVAFVTASGNASSTTIGLTGTLEGKSEVSAFKLEVGGIRVSSRLTDRTATGTGQGDFVLNETVREEKSAENYFARARFDRDLGENNFFVFGGAGWERNTFAGFNDRYSMVVGVGDAFVNDDRTLFKADIGGTYTIQKDVEPTPGKDEGFGGLRSNVEFKRSLTETTDFETLLVADENLADTEDFRVDWKVALSVSLTDGLALKTSYRMLFDNQPALVKVPLFDAGNNPLDQSVVVPSEKFDNFVTLSLVISL